MSRKGIRPWWYFAAGVVGLLLLAWGVLRWPPENVYIELIGLNLFFASGYSVVYGLTNKRKTALALMVLVGGSLVLRRMDILDVLTGILLVIISLLISFIN